MESERYDYSEFYDHTYLTTTSTSAHEIVSAVWTLIQPSSVVDIGCGVGLFLSAFAAKGVKDLCGIDGEWVKAQDLRIPQEAFIVRDLRQPVRLNRRFELAVCLEVAEHLPAAAAPVIVESLAELAPVILFSAAVPQQGGFGHLNEQWPEYWTDLFARHGFVAVDCIRPRIWDNAKVLFWYAQNCLLFVRKEQLGAYPVVQRELEQPLRLPLAVVHPRAFLYHHECVAAQRAQQQSLQWIVLQLKIWLARRLQRLRKAEMVGPAGS
jgi:SAM-dependent methyltransferase